MPLPSTPTTVEGGCNCRAIRYKISIPAEDERPIYPSGGAESNPPVRMPFACIDHCNDCRTATGALLPCWFLVPMSMVSISLVQRSPEPNAGRLPPTIIRGPWRPAVEVFLADTANDSTFLAFFASSPARRRSFCARCGTMVAYSAFPTPARHGFPMLDIVLGTVDKAYLETDGLRPERQLWWKLGIDWVQAFTRVGLGVPVYETSNLTGGPLADAGP